MKAKFNSILAHILTECVVLYSFDGNTPFDSATKFLKESISVSMGST